MDFLQSRNDAFNTVMRSKPLNGDRWLTFHVFYIDFGKIKI